MRFDRLLKGLNLFLCIHFKGSFREVSIQVNRITSLFYKSGAHVVYAMPSLDAAPRFSPRMEKYFVLDERNVFNEDMKRRCGDLLAINPENYAYIKEIKRSKMIAVLFYVNDTLVHYGFLYLVNRTKSLLGLPRSGALVGNSYTVPSYRGKGCQGRSILVRAYIAGKIGYSTVFAETSFDNKSSQRGMEKAGMKCIGVVQYRLILRYIVIRLRRPVGVAILGVCV